ncbi:MAG: TrkH family potassium uptake protein [Firmicutes bacterium]|nr:TrkH family potassium uptake protein [Bacillota bacterium]
MNRKLILRILSRAALAEAALLLISAVVGLLHGDAVLIPFGVPILLLLLVFLALGRVKPQSKDFFAREGFVSVALAWGFMSLFGALPFCLSGAIPSFLDSVFETVSGFTTTGASLLGDVELMPKGLLFWRSFTHWIGGMGVLVFLLALTALAGDRSIYLMRAESPGPSVGKLTPRLRASAGILYLIYLAMTVLLIALLLLGGMEPFDSVTNAFSIAGTGGFAVRNGGIAAYHSAYIENVMTLFMILFGTNFTLYYFVLAKKPLEALANEELRWYLGIFAAATLAVTISILPGCAGVLEALRLAAFQNASMMSTTGFATADFNLWPVFSHMFLLLLMFVGASAGSTGGGFKVSRVALLLKSIRRELSRTLHPRSVGRINFDGKTVETETSHGVLVYLSVYVLIATTGVLLVSLNGYDHVTTFSAVMATFNNIGPGLGLVGPMENFSVFSPFSKIVLSALMLLGRLEIYPILMVCSPSVWRRK